MTIKLHLLIGYCLLAAILFTPEILAQAPPTYSTSAIQLMLKKLSVLGRVLYVAAHPDDENTNLITYYANYQNMDVAYLSLTRGDGGQNLVGSDIGDALGIIRTQELLAARRIDGGRQFFTRAQDFGYSKTSSETLNVWDEHTILADMVMVIRQFKPDIMITRFPPLKYNYITHGHHTASADLAEKAFALAGDKTAFPEQLAMVDVWQPKRLYWNTSTWFYQNTGTQIDITDKIIVDVGAYIAALGSSCPEIAAESRSRHQSQGFGTAKKRGVQLEYLEYVMGEPARQDLFDDLDHTWKRVKDCDRIEALVEEVNRQFNPNEPAAILPQLIDLHKLLAERDDFWLRVKLKEVEELITAVTGLFLEVTTDDYSASAMSGIKMTLTAINRSDAVIDLTATTLTVAGKTVAVSTLPDAVADANMTKGVSPLQPASLPSTESAAKSLAFNEPMVMEKEFIIPHAAPITQPFWLVDKPASIGMYQVNDPSLAIMPESPMDSYATFILRIAGVEISYVRPLQFKWTDRVKGELYRPFIITPEVTINPQQTVVIYTGDEPREIVLQVKAWANQVSGECRLELPAGWSSIPETRAINLGKKGDEQLVSFTLQPGKSAIQFELRPILKTAGGIANLSAREIAYDHIPIQNYWPAASIKIVKLDLRKSGKRIGYVMGPGDEVAGILGQIGYQVEILNKDKMPGGNLAVYDAILIGIRAYNTEAWLPQQHEKLMEYVKQGGKLIVQYQTTGGLLTQDIGPYPFKIGRDRVTVETATMDFIVPTHPIFNAPNQLTAADFAGWVQERGLYFASEWDERYLPLFSCHDPDEEPVKGSLLLAQYGKGIFIYTGLSFFRQLPAGVPGAYRLLANMISFRNSLE